MHDTNFSPGMRIILRDEEWMIKKVETNSFGNQTIYLIGLSQAMAVSRSLLQK